MAIKPNHPLGKKKLYYRAGSTVTKNSAGGGISGQHRVLREVINPKRLSKYSKKGKR